MQVRLHMRGFFLRLRRIPLSQLFSISPLTFLHSLFHSFKLIFSNTSIFFTLNHVSPSQKKHQVSLLTAARCPPGSPTLLLFCSLLHPLTLFQSLYLCLDVAHTHTFQSLCVSPHGWSDEQRKGKGPVLLQSYRILLSV